jgi:hypothetical protein
MGREDRYLNLSNLRGCPMNSWYLPAIPAALALSVIAYSLWLGYA